jgi:tRNA threonylcarbamoyl adenosine modification protein (Sua5/YciO/YrdC/YwlC family)
MPAAVIDLRNSDDPRDAIHRAVAALAAGQIVAIPTETVYGLAASALCPAAVERLIQVKGRDKKPLALAIKSADDALDYVPHMSALALRLARRCWPGPLTMVLNDTHPDSVLIRLPESVLQHVLVDGKIGLRVPSNSIALQVLRLSAGPLVLTSANPSGLPPAVEARQIMEQLGHSIDLILDDGPSPIGNASTVIEVLKNDFKVLRDGAVGADSLRQLTYFLCLVVCTGNTCRSPMAEALLKQRVAKRLGCAPNELEQRGIAIRSGGIAAMPGGLPSAQAVEVMESMGMDISEHCSQPVTDRLARHADLILTMTQGHRRAIVGQWPDLESRIFLFSVDHRDVSDPVGHSTAVYRQCADELQASVDHWANRILAESTSDALSPG